MTSSFRPAARAADGASTPTSIDIEDGPGHKPVHHEENDRLGDVIGSSNAPHWLRMRNAIEMSPRLSLRETQSPEWGVDLTRRDRVNPDRSQLQRQGARQGFDGAVDRRQRRHFNGR